MRGVRQVLVASVAAGSCLWASPALAADKKPPAPPALYSKLSACRTITTAEERLKCYDDAAAALDLAVSRKDVIMVDKQQVQKSRRTLFGLPLPDFNLFGDDDGPEEQKLTQIDSTVKSVSANGDGWRITIAEGSTWQQIDGTPLALAPKPGMAVTVKRAALGSYKMSVRKQPPIKVKRIF